MVEEYEQVYSSNVRRAATAQANSSSGGGWDHKPPLPNHPANPGVVPGQSYDISVYLPAEAQEVHGIYATVLAPQELGLLPLELEFSLHATFPTHREYVAIIPGSFLENLGTYQVSYFAYYVDTIISVSRSFLITVGEDGDGDGVIDPHDNCPGTFNPDQTDSNGNGIGDVCESGVCAGSTVVASSMNSQATNYLILILLPALFVLGLGLRRR